ncbi:hypothetical protein [Nocardia cyriacigeorgica]|uniref:hypothetical protein n=1 Tax=Nocardia cyriacigeorgica TaxID=135487 RepID=UPI0014860831|nr:hypothetical protein [Nocardia cyriacigeorgica]
MITTPDHADLHHLIDRLTPAQARHLREIISDDPELPSADVTPIGGEPTVPDAR